MCGYEFTGGDAEITVTKGPFDELKSSLPRGFAATVGGHRTWIHCAGDSVGTGGRCTGFAEVGAEVVTLRLPLPDGDLSGRTGQVLGKIAERVTK